MSKYLAYAGDLAEENVEALKKQGMPIKTTLDIDIPDLPTDITAVDDQELMNLATKYMANYSFMLTQVALSEICLTEAENNYDIEEAKLLLSKSTGKTTEKSLMLKAAVLVDPTMMASADIKMGLYAYNKLVKTILDNLERSYQLVSRELTRRTSVIKARGY